MALSSLLLARAVGNGEIDYEEFLAIMRKKGSLLSNRFSQAITRIQARFRGSKDRRETNKVIDEVLAADLLH